MTNQPLSREPGYVWDVVEICDRFQQFQDVPEEYVIASDYAALRAEVEVNKQAFASLREENERLTSEGEMLKSEMGYHEAKDVIEQLTEQRDVFKAENERLGQDAAVAQIKYEQLAQEIDSLKLIYTPKLRTIVTKQVADLTARLAAMTQERDDIAALENKSHGSAERLQRYAVEVLQLKQQLATLEAKLHDHHIEFAAMHCDYMATIGHLDNAQARVKELEDAWNIRTNNVNEKMLAPE